MVGREWGRADGEYALADWSPPCSQRAQGGMASWRVGLLPCSRNARPQKALVGRAQSEQTNPHSREEHSPIIKK